VAGATPFPKVGWSDHPIFGQGVASATPYRPYGGGRSHPRPLGVVRPPQKAQKKGGGGENGFWPLGVAGPPPRAWRWPKPPPTAGRGCPKPPPGPRGWSGHPQRPKPISPPPPPLFFWAFWGGRTTPKGLGWVRPPPYGRYGVAEATPWPKMGWSGHPTFGKGVAPATPIPSSLFFFFFFFFFFNFLLFFKKKKKKKT
jgi:hypothetical protein